MKTQLIYCKALDHLSHCRRPVSGAQGLHHADLVRLTRTIHRGRSGWFFAARQRGAQGGRTKEA